MSSLPLPAGTTAHAQPCPEARTGFVFICPGRHEANRGYPCAAGTGAPFGTGQAAFRRGGPGPTGPRHRTIGAKAPDSGGRDPRIGGASE